MVEGTLAGAGQFLMVSGDAGIGKTAVLGALIGRAGPEALVLPATCWEGDGTPPYWPCRRSCARVELQVDPGSVGERFTLGLMQERQHDNAEQVRRPHVERGPGDAACADDQ